jgi:hypothetical protein
MPKHADSKRTEQAKQKAIALRVARKAKAQYAKAK